MAQRGQTCYASMVKECENVDSVNNKIENNTKSIGSKHPSAWRAKKAQIVKAKNEFRSIFTTATDNDVQWYSSQKNQKALATAKRCVAGLSPHQVKMHGLDLRQCRRGCEEVLNQMTCSFCLLINKV